MTPEQERALLAATVAGLDDALREALAEVIERIQGGEAPRDAVQAVVGAFAGEMAETMATAMSGLLAASVGAESVLALEVGAVSLSRRMYAEAGTTGEAVQGAVQRHVNGFQDSRRLALELFEGYGFRDPEAEPLKLDPSNPQLPKYLREALLTDDKVLAGMKRAFAGLQVDNLTTPGLRAAYQQALEALDAIEAGAGQALLDKRIEVAFYERMRYFAERIARTELHRSYSEREALLLMADADVEFVQIRRAPGRGAPCICVLFTGRDLYGMGPGVYPKALAPRPPFHPFCLPGDALVTAAGRVIAATKRRFDGDLVVITTAGGKRLSATVNHPILTRRGWVGAGLLDVGDQVFTRVDAVAVGGDSFIDDQHQDVPPSIAEIANALLGSSEVTTREVPVTAEHFHGDGEGSDVAVIGADGELWNRINAEAYQVAYDQRFGVAGAGTAGLFGKSVLDLGGKAPGLAPECSVCGGSVGDALLRGEFGISDGLSGAPATAFNAGAVEPSFNDVAADAELARQIQNGSAGEVFADDVVHIERVKFSGHVFNLETDQGHYTANGIVTHNCMCVMSPRLDLTGRTAQERDPQGDAYFLNRLNGSVSARIMGSQAKRDAVLRGLTPEQVVNASRDPQYHVKTIGG